MEKTKIYAEYDEADRLWEKGMKILTATGYFLSGFILSGAGLLSLKTPLNIGLAAACVSMLTLASTMLTTFGDGTMSLSERRILLGSVGGAVSLFIILMAVYMIVQSTKKLKRIRSEVTESGK